LKQIREKKYCIISIDGIQDTVYLIREVTTGRLLHAQNVSSSDKNTMKYVLSQIRDLNLPITGFISDAQETIVSAISELWPNVPHQTCQFPYFQEAARPIYEEDRAIRKEMRKTITPPLKALRGQLAKGIAAIKDEETEEAHNERKQLQILDTCAVAAKSSLNRDGNLPFNYSGLKGYQDLDALEKSLDDMKKKASESGKKTSKKVLRKLKRLQEIIASRKKWQEKMSQIEKMQKWVLETEHILSGDFAGKDAALTNERVAERFDQHIAILQAQLVSGEKLTETEKECLKHFIKISLNLRPRLIICYDVLDLPRTDNDMEQSIRRIKTRYRRISGRKNWNAYLLRYGQSISYFDYFEQNGLDQNAFLAMFCRVNRNDWRDTRKFHRSIQTDRLNVFRFRHNQDAFLHQLQECWEQTLA
jgi:hypothetical protein